MHLPAKKVEQGKDALACKASISYLETKWYSGHQHQTQDDRSQEEEEEVSSHVRGRVHLQRHHAVLAAREAGTQSLATITTLLKVVVFKSYFVFSDIVWQMFSLKTVSIEE